MLTYWFDISSSDQSFIALFLDLPRYVVGTDSPLVNLMIREIVTHRYTVHRKIEEEEEPSYGLATTTTTTKNQ